MDYSLSVDEVKSIAKGKTNFYTYPQLKKFKSIESALKPYGAMILLYMTEKNYGHYVCVIDQGDRIEFFDSYSAKPDHQFDYIDKKKRREYNYEGIPYLTDLLLKSKKPVEYNHRELQEYKDGISTCGRWVGFRILTRDIKLDNFIKIFDLLKEVGIKPDEAILKLAELK